MFVLCESSQSTISRADCYAALTALESNIVKMLEQSKIVRLGNLGSFQIAVKSEGKETMEEVNASVVKGSRNKIFLKPNIVVIEPEMYFVVKAQINE